MNGVRDLVFFQLEGSSHPANAIANAFSTRFQLIIQRARLPLVGSRNLVTRCRRFCAAALFGSARVCARPCGN